MARVSKIQELQELINTITEIYIGAKENFRFCYHLHFSERAEEVSYLSIDRHLNFIRHSLWRLTIIELAKLYNTKHNERYSISKLLRSLNRGNHFGNIGVKFKSLAKWQESIDHENNTIRRINDLRDKIYAHTDPNGAIYKNIEIYFSEITRLFDITISIINDLNATYTGNLLIHDSPIFESQDFEIVKVLTANHQKTIRDIESILKK